jgi:hypothetical protein
MQRHSFSITGAVTLIALILLGQVLESGTHHGIAASPGSSESGHYSDMVTPHGHADWTAGVVTAKGFGVPPKNPASALQAREMARTAAWSVALRNLLEVVKGVYVDSTTTINNYVTTNDEIRTRVEGMVKGAKVVKEQELPDGSYETTVEMKIAGDLSSLVQPKTMPRSDPLPRYQPKTQAPGPVQPKAYTGLVIDARGTGAKAGMYPRIVNEEGEEAYSVAYVKQKPSPDDRIVVYVPDPVTAQAHPRVTAVPLTVKALRSEGNNHTDLVISDADAQTIHGVPEHFRFLKQAKVLIILDQK